MLPTPSHDRSQILHIGQGPYAQKLISNARTLGLRFDLDWEDLGQFIKLVNDDWSHDPGAGAGWFPPKVFHGIPRLHLTRTMTILFVMTYFMEALSLHPQDLVEGGLSPLQSWCGCLALEGPAALITEPDRPPLQLLEVMYIYGPPPIHVGIQRALEETTGIQEFLPGTGLGFLYAFARSAGEIQGFSQPFLEREGALLPASFAEMPSPFLIRQFFKEPLNATRIARHLERYHELFDMPPSLDRAWKQAAEDLMGRLIGPERILR